MKPLVNHKCALIPMWLAVIAVRTSTGYAETEPLRIASPRTCVNLLPPEAIEQEFIQQNVTGPSIEQSRAVSRLAMRERFVKDQIESAGSAVRSHLSSRFDETQTGLLVVCAGVAAGGLWLAFGHWRPVARDVRSAGSRVESARVDLLKLLIANSLPIIEEPLIFPATARLHGRPIVVERYRLDVAQPLSDPHFVVASPTDPIDVDVVHWVSAAEPDVKQPSYRRIGPNPLERELATVERDD